MGNCFQKGIVYTKYSVHIKKKVHPYKLVSENGIFNTKYTAVVNNVKGKCHKLFAENDNIYKKGSAEVCIVKVDKC